MVQCLLEFGLVLFILVQCHQWLILGCICEGDKIWGHHVFWALWYLWCWMDSDAGHLPCFLWLLLVPDRNSSLVQHNEKPSKAKSWFLTINHMTETTEINAASDVSYPLATVRLFIKTEATLKCLPLMPSMLDGLICRSSTLRSSTLLPLSSHVTN